MNKIAQRRSVLNKLREMTNVSGIAAEKFFNPQFQEVMENLRAVDANIRSNVAGQVLDGGDVGAIDRSLKDILASAKSKINRREFMTAVAELGRFHSKLREVMTQIAHLHENVDKVHHQFLFQDLDDEHKQQLQDLPGRWAATNQSTLTKEGFGESISDFLHNVLNDRGRALSFYEKRYPKKVGALKSAALKMVTRSQALLALVLSSLKEMASARATRNPDKYMQAAKKIEKGYGAYDTAFKEFYNGSVKEYENFFKSIPKPEVQKDPFPTSKAPGSQAPDTIPAGTTTLVPSGDETETASTIPSAPSTGVPTVVPTGSAPPIARAPGAPLGNDLMGYLQEAEELKNKPPSTPAPPASSGPQSVAPVPSGTPGSNPSFKQPIMAHEKFWESLEAMSGEHPSILRSYIKKYAAGVQSSDPTTAVKLLQIAKSIRG